MFFFYPLEGVTALQVLGGVFPSAKTEKPSEREDFKMMFRTCLQYHDRRRSAWIFLYFK